MMEGTTRLVIELPPITPDEAASLIEIFEQMIGELWRKHGDQLADHLNHDHRTDPVTKQKSDFPF